MNKHIKNDRRQHKRYYVKNRLFAVICPENSLLDQISHMSKGAIAFAIIKSNPLKMGEIKEISQSGLSFHYIHNDHGNKSEFMQETTLEKMDILFVDENFHLCRIPFRIIRDACINPNGPFHSLAMKRLTVKFGGLSVKQKEQLAHVIENFTTGEIPVKFGYSIKQAWSSRA